MGVIQGSINSLLTTAGIAARLSPELENKAEERKELGRLKRKEKALETSMDVQGNTTAPGADTEEAEDLYENTVQRRAEISQEIYELQPTEKNYRNVIDMAQAVTEVRDMRDWKNTNRQKALQAQQAALETAQEERRQGEQFRQGFLEGVPTNDVLARQSLISGGK